MTAKQFDDFIPLIALPILMAILMSTMSGLLFYGLLVKGIPLIFGVLAVGALAIAFMFWWAVYFNFTEKKWIEWNK